MIHTSYSAEKLRSLRQRAMLSQREVEKMTGVARPTLSRLETGKNKPQTRVLRRLLTLYAISIRTNEQQEKIWQKQP